MVTVALVFALAEASAEARDASSATLSVTGPDMPDDELLLLEEEDELDEEDAEEEAEAPRARGAPST